MSLRRQHPWCETVRSSLALCIIEWRRVEIPKRGRACLVAHDYKLPNDAREGGCGRGIFVLAPEKDGRQ